MTVITYTIFTDDHSTGDINDIDLPIGTTIIEAQSQAERLSSSHYYYNSSIRLAAYIDGSDCAKCIWANEVAYSRGIAAPR